MAEIRTVAVIGAGMLGEAVAQLALLGGYRTILEDILPASLRRAKSAIQGSLDEAITLGAVSKTQVDAALARLEFAATVENAARPADLVIEAVPDEMESKIEMFTLLDKICKPGTILAACNTSSLSITEIASVTYRGTKILGMRFFPENRNIKSMEIVRGLETDEETMDACSEVARRMGLNVTVIQEPAHVRPATM